MNRTVLASGEGEETLKMEYEKELLTFHKHELIFEALKQIKDSELKNFPNLKKVLLQVAVKDYINLGSSRGEDGTLLGINFSWKNVELTYSEKKFLQQAVERYASQKSNLIEKTHCIEIIDEVKASREKILATEQQRRNLTKEVSELEVKRHNLMKRVAELRVGTHQLHTVDMINDKALMTEHKASLLQKVCAANFMSQTPYTPKAIKDVEANIDNILKDKK